MASKGGTRCRNSSGALAFSKPSRMAADGSCEMTEISGLGSQYDAFLFASLCQEDELPLSVLSMLARQDLDPWQEAGRLAQLSKEQAINSLASKIWNRMASAGHPRRRASLRSG
jgi:hypothetical protein